MEKQSKIMAFRKSDDARTELGNLLGNKTLQWAIDAIREKGIPKSVPKVDTLNHPDTIIAHEFHKMVGINYALDLLERMTYPLDTHPEDEKEPEEAFVHTLPAHLRTPPKGFTLPKQ
jgi:hypothetical protein